MIRAALALWLADRAEQLHRLADRLDPLTMDWYYGLEVGLAEVREREVERELVAAGDGFDVDEVAERAEAIRLATRERL